MYLNLIYLVPGVRQHDTLGEYICRCFCKSKTKNPLVCPLVKEKYSKGYQSDHIAIHPELYKHYSYFHTDIMKMPEEAILLILSEVKSTLCNFQIT